MSLAGCFSRLPLVTWMEVRQTLSLGVLLLLTTFFTLSKYMFGI